MTPSLHYSRRPVAILSQGKASVVTEFKTQKAFWAWAQKQDAINVSLCEGDRKRVTKKLESFGFSVNATLLGEEVHHKSVLEASR